MFDIQEVISVELIKNFLVNNRPMMTLRRLIGRYCDGDDRSPAFFLKGHIANTFRGLGNVSPSGGN